MGGVAFERNRRINQVTMYGNNDGHATANATTTGSVLQDDERRTAWMTRHKRWHDKSSVPCFPASWMATGWMVTVSGGAQRDGDSEDGRGFFEHMV